MKINFDTKAIEFTEEEQGLLVKLTHNTSFTTGQVISAIVETWTANFHQDINDIIKELEEEQ